MERWNCRGIILDVGVSAERASRGRPRGHPGVDAPPGPERSEPGGEGRGARGRGSGGPGAAPRRDGLEPADDDRASRFSRLQAGGPAPPRSLRAGRAKDGLGVRAGTQEAGGERAAADPPLGHSRRDKARPNPAFHPSRPRVPPSPSARPLPRALTHAPSAHSARGPGPPSRPPPQSTPGPKPPEPPPFRAPSTPFVLPSLPAGPRPTPVRTPSGAEPLRPSLGSATPSAPSAGQDGNPQTPARGVATPHVSRRDRGGRTGRVPCRGPTYSVRTEDVAGARPWGATESVWRAVGDGVRVG